MIRIKDYIISLDLFEKKFVCDLQACMGNCCRYGDSGAPLEPGEVILLEQLKDHIVPYLREQGKKAVIEKGTSLRDFEGDMVTPLIGNEECAYTIVDNNIYMCAIEKAWSDGKISFRKPLSCHLFPARIRKYPDFKAINCEEWSICAPAKEKGSAKGIYVYEFLKESLTRSLGEDVYEEICHVAKGLRKNELIGSDPQVK